MASNIFTPGRFEAARQRAALAALALLAVGGYVIGHNAWSGGTHGVTPVRPTLVANVLLEYPTGWRTAAGAPLLSVLPLEGTSVFAPGGRARESGLLVGSLREGEPGPLPRPLLAALRAPLRAAVVNLSELQAYRYSGASVAGFTGSLVLYAIPGPDRTTTVAACYALPRGGADAFMGACARAIDGVTELGQSLELAPAPAYARALHAAIGTVELARARAASAAAAAATLATVRVLGAALASAFSRATAALEPLEAPVPASRAHAALLRALSSASSAYTALAATAAEGAPEGRARSRSLARARTRARASEAAVDEALETFTLLGYGDVAPSGAAGVSPAR